MAPEALAVLCCPRCSGPLEPAAGPGAELACRPCSETYPLIGDIPCLIHPPSVWRARWLARCRDFLASTERRLAELERETELPDLLPRTRERLRRLARGFAESRNRIRERYAKLGAPSSAGAAAALPVEAGAGSAVLKCYENLFRDWVWGEREHEAALSLIERVRPEPLGRVAIYGAGAGRLAAEVHRRLEPELVFALDINPFPLLVAEELVRGGQLELPEFPVGPSSEQKLVVTQTLRCPFPVGPGLVFLFADGLEAPFPPGSLDTVLTPWFIDAVDADFRRTLDAVQRVLRPGGVWIHVGPLRFDGSISTAYLIEEVVELARERGFEVGSPVERELPYFHSPHSGSRRLETVFAFAARNSAARPRHFACEQLPAWLVDPAQPIPKLPELDRAQRTSVFTLGVLSMVDGTRSIAELSRALGQRWKVPAENLEPQLRVFFERLIRS